MTKGPKPKGMAERFWPKVDKSKECWEWTGCRTPLGYGKISSGVRNYPVTTHRASWEMHFGAIPKGMLVCHRCDNRRCVRPDHLFLGTHADNCADKISKGRQKSPHLTQEQVDEIRRLHSEYGRTIRYKLAEQFHISDQTVHDIVTFRTWAK